MISSHFCFQGKYVSLPPLLDFRLHIPYRHHVEGLIGYLAIPPSRRFASFLHHRLPRNTLYSDAKAGPIALLPALVEGRKGEIRKNIGGMLEVKEGGV